MNELRKYIDILDESHILAESNYWSNNEKVDAFNRIYEKLVPNSGPCETEEGEMMRAAARLVYECYNNGFGNNSSGAYFFLADTLPSFTRSERIEYHMYGEKEYNGRFNDDDPVIQDLTALIDAVMAYVSPRFEQNNLTPFDGDMFDHEQENPEPDDDEEDEWYDDEDEDDWDYDEDQN